jgi:hypothetical protein
MPIFWTIVVGFFVGFFAGKPGEAGPPLNDEWKVEIRRVRLV